MQRFMIVILLLVGASATTSCGESTQFETRRQMAAQAGGWKPPGDIVSLADSFNIENIQAGPWVGESGCSDSFTTGARQVRDWILEYWAQVPRIHGYQCRRIAGTNLMSVHGTGRALDIVIPIDTTKPREDSADNDAGDPLANYMLEHAEEFGVQQIIWDNKIWTSSNSPGSRFRNYRGSHPHNDHIHLELNPSGASTRTPWFDTAMGPPDFGPCGDPIGAEGGVIDDSDDCFSTYGPSQYWRSVSGEGHGGSLRWTNAWEADNPSNWARWNIELAEAGRYRVEYHHVSEYAVYDSAQYRIRHDGAEEDLFLDLSAGEDGWQLLGEFDFAAGDDQWVSLYDNSNGPVPDGQHIIADAIRLRPPLPAEEPIVGNPPELDDPDDADIDITEPDAEPDETNVDETAPQREGGEMVIHGRSGCSSTQAWPSRLALVLFLAFAFFRRRLSPGRP